MRPGRQACSLGGATSQEAVRMGKEFVLHPVAEAYPAFWFMRTVFSEAL